MKKSQVKNQNSKKVSKETKCADVSSANASSPSSKSTKKTPPPAPTRYNVRPGTIDFGKDYEIQIAALLALRCSGKYTRDMWLGMNLEESGDFDDIVLYRKTQDGKEFLYMIQLKFNTKSENISLGDFKKEKGDFSLKKYMTAISNMDKNIRSQSESKVASEIIDYFKYNHDKIVFVIFTNRPMVDQSLCNNVNIADWMHNVILTGGKVFKFDYGKFNLSVESTVEKYTQNLFLLTEQIHIKDLSVNITEEIGKLIQPLKLTTGRLKEVVKNFVLFITEWSKGRLGGHYPITKDHVWKVLLEQVFTPYMIKLDETRGNGMFENKLWMQIIEDKDMTVIRADDLVCEFLYNYIRSEIKKNCADYKKLRGSKRDDIAKQTFQVVTKSKEVEFEIYEFLWKSRQLPLVLKVDESEELEIILQKLEKFHGLFRIIILTQSVSAFSRETTLKTFTTVEDLTVNHRSEILEHSVKLQGRTFIKLADVITADMYCHLTVGEVIKIISGNFIIGNLPSRLPHTFINRSLEKVWLKNEVLQETSDNVFLIKCNLLNDFEFFVQTYKLKTKESKIYKWPKLESEFDSLSNIDIIIFENECNLNKIRNLNFLKTTNVHYLSLHATQNLEWIASFGSTKNIRKFRENSNSCYSLETHNMNDLIEATRYRSIQFPKLITGGPGIGKSFLMDYISVCTSMDMWILKINLLDHFDYYKNVKFRNTSSAELEHLLYFCNKTMLQNDNDNITKEVFKQYLNNKKIFLILDAFDEVPDGYQSNVKKIIKSIDDAGFPLCTTTRPFLKTELEELLDTFAVTIKPFSKQDKHNITFLAAAGDGDTNLIQLLLDAVVDTEAQDQYGRTALMRASRNGHIETVQLLLNKHAAIEAKDNDGMTSLIWAASNGHTNVIQFLLDKGAHIEAQNQRGITALMDASENGHIETVQLLLNKHAAIEGKDNEGSNSLDSAAYNGHTNVVQLLLDRGANIEAQGQYGRTALMCASRNGHIETVQLLLNKHAAIEANDNDGRTSLICAASMGHSNVIQLLLDKGADIEAHDECGVTVLMYASAYGRTGTVQLLLNKHAAFAGNDNKGRTSLIWAAINGHTNVIQLLLDKGADIEAQDQHGITALLYGSQNGYTDTVQLLLNRHAAIEAKDNKGNTSLGLATQNGHTQVVQLLLDRGANIEAQGQYGRTALMCASGNGHIETVQLLLNNHAPIEACDNESRTSLFWASHKGHTNVVQLLLERGANIEARSRHRKTALIYASENGHTDTVQLLLNNHAQIEACDKENMTSLIWAATKGHTNVVQLLLERGANIEAQNQYGKTALMCASHDGHVDTVHLLLTMHAAIEADDNIRATSLLWAAHNGHTSVVQLLLENGANIEAQPQDGKTALMAASYKGHSDTVQLLLNNQAAIEAKDNAGATALYCAADMGHIDVVKMLINRGADLETKCNSGKTALMVASEGKHTAIEYLLSSKIKLIRS